MSHRGQGSKGQREQGLSKGGTVGGESVIRLEGGRRQHLVVLVFLKTSPIE